MIVKPFFDADLIEDYVLNSGLIEVIGDDLDDKKRFKPDPNDLWLTVEDEESLIGLCCFSVVNSITLDIHPLFSVYGKGREAIYYCLQWLKNQRYRRVEKIVAAIPVCYKSVLNCAKKLGFKDEGRSSKSFLKNGVLYDRIYLGLDLAGVELKV